MNNDTALPTGKDPVVKFVVDTTTLETPSGLRTIADMEKELILLTMNAFKGNKTKASQSLGVTIKTLYNKLHEYGEFENYAVHPKKG